jgi:hypothetical protein
MSTKSQQEIERIQRLAPWATWVPTDGQLTIDDYLRLRDSAQAAGDSGKYELVEGWLFVTRYDEETPTHQ